MNHLLKWAALLFLGTILLFGLTACRQEPLKPQEPQVLILSPEMNAHVSGSETEINIFVDNFDLVDKLGQENGFGEGHVIYYADVQPPLTFGQSALPEKGSYVESTEKSYTWKGLKPGKHSLWIQLVNNDSTVLLPAQAVWVDVTVPN